MDQVFVVRAVEQFALQVVNWVLSVAALLRDEASPGYVVIALVLLLIFAIGIFVYTTHRRCAALRWMQKMIAQSSGGQDFAERLIEMERSIEAKRLQSASPYASVASAWSEYRETLVYRDKDGPPSYRNAVRPSVFFNLEDLHFGPGFWRAVPGLFVTFGLFLTFLGLISALVVMGEEMRATGEVSQDAMTQLLTVASAKFIMSLTGLLCSIVFVIFLRVGTGRVEKAIHSLNHALERRLSFLSLEGLAVEQLRAIDEQRNSFRSIGMELVAELGRPLREELPLAISTSISRAMGPLIEQLGRTGEQGIGKMVEDLSSRFSTDVKQALEAAAAQIAQAGDRMEGLAGRMDQASGRMGAEMEAAIVRLAEGLDDVQKTVAGGAAATAGAMAEGAEELRGVVTALGTGAAGIQRASEDLNTAAQATLQAVLAMQGEGAQLTAAATPIRESVDQLTNAATELSQCTRSIADSTRSNAEAVKSTLEAAREALGGERRAMETTIRNLDDLLKRFEGQGDRLDDLDEKLGKAFDKFREKVEVEVNALHGHVEKMNSEMAPAIDKLREVVELAERYIPRSEAP